ncbi:MAG: hypothetical protein A3A44_01695 [Candidatus Sungbacteria bacterium RIFCSPLOWO2_01_FULL_60_25]|uniref:Type IV secretion system coupling protein TraD DNA-binding domain-containing protein n=1 Tax=Candidatus Sungbacteria bacterium RIFCSPLOWO2_01_FULL_60_25 TaxID=1802281 RepID=A0A1G2LH16_9BACT|nr:MAG: hypothetical protein A3A44_01695 [Candidatus Sungbacteria bacterium RIFCSPLOWO2_01_FULL_60_25]
MSPFLIGYFSLVAVLILLGVAAFLLHRRQSRDAVWRSLNLRLLAVSLPRITSQESIPLEELRDRISIMEKVYAGLRAIREPWWKTAIAGKPAFALEITVPHIGEEIAMYIAVPRRFAQMAEKMIESTFTDAHIQPVEDYNIFNPTGAAAAATLTLKRSPILPLKTYRRLETDPLRELANAFSRIAHTGEGAALQIVARPAAGKWSGKIAGHAKQIYLGKSPLSPRNAVERGLAAAQATGQKSRKSPNEPESQHRLSPQEEEQVRLIETKGAKPLFEANVRIIGSAATEERATAIVHDIGAAFLQHTDPGLNEFVVRPLAGRERSRSLFRFSFRLFDPKTALILSSEELTSIWHLPNVPLEAPKLRAVKAREAPPPVSMLRAGLRLGTSVFRGETRDAYLGEDDRRRHLYIVGQTGTGKTNFMMSMIRQDIGAGRGVCFIDPHGDTAESLLAAVPPERANDVIYFNPADTERPLGLNMLEYDLSRPDEKTFVVNELFSIFQKLYGAVPESMGPMFEQYFRNATLLVMDDPASGNTLLEVERIFVDKAFRAEKLSRSTNVVVQTFWREMAEKAGGDASLANMAPYITSKFDTFLANDIMRPIIAQERSAFNFRRVMDEQKILLINLSKGRLGELNSSLLGLILVGKVLMAALSRTDIPESERRDFYFYIDEFQNVTTPSIATILSEARKYRLDLIMAHQFLGQLTDEIRKAVFGNVGSLASFRIGSDDAEILEQQFQPVFSGQDLLNIDNHNAYVKLLINGETSRPFNIKTLPPEPIDRARGAAIREYSRMTYGRMRGEIEEEINKRYQKGAITVSM